MHKVNMKGYSVGPAAYLPSLQNFSLGFIGSLKWADETLSSPETMQKAFINPFEQNRLRQIFEGYAAMYREMGDYVHIFEGKLEQQKVQTRQPA